MYLGVNVSPKELAQRAESLVRHSSNRYLTTVRIAFRAKQRRFDDFDGLLAVHAAGDVDAVRATLAPWIESIWHEKDATLERARYR